MQELRGANLLHCLASIYKLHPDLWLDPDSKYVMYKLHPNLWLHLKSEEVTLQAAPDLWLHPNSK